MMKALIVIGLLASLLLAVLPTLALWYFYCLFRG